jgi:hypothetical protein
MEWQADNVMRLPSQSLEDGTNQSVVGSTAANYRESNHTKGLDAPRSGETDVEEANRFSIIDDHALNFGFQSWTLMKQLSTIVFMLLVDIPHVMLCDVSWYFSKFH